MRKGLLLLPVLSLFLSSISLANPRTYTDIVKSKELRICYTLWLSKDTLPDFPSPYMEMAVAFAEKKHLQPKIKKIVWGDQFQNAQGKTLQGETYTPALFDSQQCDMYSTNISPMEWRKKILDLNWIYISSLTVVVRKEDRKKFHTTDDLKSKTVYVVPNTTYHAWLLNFQNTLPASEKMNIKEVTEGGTIAHLLNKDSDFILFESQNALYAKSHISPDISLAFTVDKPMESGWGFPKGAVELQKETVSFFDEEKKSSDSKVNQIFKRYFGMSLSEYEKLQQISIP